MRAPIPVLDRIPRQRCWSPPNPVRRDGEPRRVGVEMEFSGLGEDVAARLVAGLWGGEIHRDPLGDWLAVGGRLGTVRIERDTALAPDGAEGLVRGALGELVPVEIVTAPLRMAALPEVDALVVALRAAGARGNGAGLGHAFGLHLNPEIAGRDAAAIVPVARAFALMEDWLRASDPLDPMRRVLPFVDPWPRRLVDALAAEGADWSLDDLASAYLALSPTRNRGLDLLPLLSWLDPDRVRAAAPEVATRAGRPTFHYRLPGSRLEDPAWSVAYEWNRWVLVERVADRPALLETLAEGWRGYRDALTSVRGDWSAATEALLAEARVWEP